MNDDLYPDDPIKPTANAQNPDLRDIDIRNDFMFSHTPAAVTRQA